MMMGILSPLTKKIVDEEKSFPSPSAKIKLNKAIGRYQLLETFERKEYMDDIRFALADLLVARGNEEDYLAAKKEYDSIIEKTKNKVLKARALVGKAELAIIGVEKMDPIDAIKLCKDAEKLLKGNLKDFFAAKGIAVEAELLVKKGGKKNNNLAHKLFDKIINKKEANAYFRGRAMVGKAELILYFGVDSLTRGLKLCEEALSIFVDRPHDYFAIKARVIEAEFLTRRGASSDLYTAEAICKKIIVNPMSHKDLVARAKLVLAEISKKDRAIELFEEVFENDNIDPYLIGKAKFVEKAIKNKIN